VIQGMNHRQQHHLILLILPAAIRIGIKVQLDMIHMLHTIQSKCNLNHRREKVNSLVMLKDAKLQVLSLHLLFTIDLNCLTSYQRPTSDLVPTPTLIHLPWVGLLLYRPPLLILIHGNGLFFPINDVKIEALQAVSLIRDHQMT
jgi:hypothetical protein